MTVEMVLEKAHATRKSVLDAELTTRLNRSRSTEEMLKEFSLLRGLNVYERQAGCEKVG